MKMHTVLVLLTFDSFDFCFKTFSGVLCDISVSFLKCIFFLLMYSKLFGPLLFIAQPSLFCTVTIAAGALVCCELEINH